MAPVDIVAAVGLSLVMAAVAVPVVGGARARVQGRVDRCQVVRLDPVRYHGAIVFDEGVDIGAGVGGSE